ncbi:hypothetical protein GQ457_18G006720 [Hibiscus cannabinus]
MVGAGPHFRWVFVGGLRFESPTLVNQLTQTELDLSTLLTPETKAVGYSTDSGNGSRWVNSSNVSLRAGLRRNFVEPGTIFGLTYTEHVCVSLP